MGLIKYISSLFKTREERDLENLRKHKRVELQNLVAHRHIGGSNFSISNLTNIGEGGLLFNVDSPYKAGELLEIELKFHRREEVLRSKVKVLWSNSSGKTGRYATGCEFVEISAADMDFIRQNIVGILESIDVDINRIKKADLKIRSRMKRRAFKKRIERTDKSHWV